MNRTGANAVIERVRTPGLPPGLVRDLGPLELGPRRDERVADPRRHLVHEDDAPPDRPPNLQTHRSQSLPRLFATIQVIKIMPSVGIGVVSSFGTQRYACPASGGLTRLTSPDASPVAPRSFPTLQMHIYSLIFAPMAGPLYFRNFCDGLTRLTSPDASPVAAPRTPFLWAPATGSVTTPDDKQMIKTMPFGALA
jgi:hypothetical protein